MKEGRAVELRISEYSNLIKKPLQNGASQRTKCAIIKKLVKSAGWTTNGADDLFTLANSYGAFMLRNALALALVIGKEDGDKGF
ncbi:MAG: hypothetical protein PHC61_03120 [Chitinivibrionales bacterium]|nr:hypothetical protein [Chitinivibrionales bacterium]